MSFKIRSVKYNFMMNLVLTGSGVLFPLITFPIVSRALLSGAYGLCSWAASVASWISLVAMLGVNRYGIREVAKVRDDEKKLARITIEILIVTLVSTMISFACFFVALFVVERFADNRQLLLINSITILFNTLGVGWFFQGIEQYSYITIRGVLIKLACLVGVLVLIHAPEDYLIYAGLTVGATAIANAVNFFYMLTLIKPNIVIQKEGLKTWCASLTPHIHIKPMLTFFIIVASISVYTTLDTVMLGFLSGDEQVGYYSAAIKVKLALQGVVSSLTGVVLPRASNMLASGKEGEYRLMIRKCLKVVLCISVPTSVFLFFTATPLMTLYAGDDFSPAGAVLSLVGITLIPIALSIVFCDDVMVPLGMERRCTFIYIGAAILDFSGNLLLIPHFGAIGAAVSTTAVECLIALAEFVIIRKWIWPKKGGKIL